MNNLTNKALVELVAAVKAGKISLVRDTYGRVIGINVNNPNLLVSDIRYVKDVAGGHKVVGKTLEDVAADEAALREFINKYNNVDVMGLTKVAEVVSKETWDENDVEYLANALGRYVAAHKEVVTREVRVPAQTTRAAAEYELDCLSIETLKAIRREATSKGDNALKNAARRALRHNGVNC